MPIHDSVLAALGHNVRQTREIKQLTQEKLAEFARLDPTYISGIERGLRNPGIKKWLETQGNKGPGESCKLKP